MPSKQRGRASSKAKQTGIARPAFAKRLRVNLTNDRRCQIFTEISIIMGDDASPADVGKELALKHEQYNAAMWTAFYEEWKRCGGKPGGYGEGFQVEPWISDELFSKLVNEEIERCGRETTNMVVVSKGLTEKYGLYSQGSWKRHAQHRLTTENPSTVRSAAKVRHSPDGKTRSAFPPRTPNEPRLEKLRKDPTKVKTPAKIKTPTIRILPIRTQPARTMSRPSYRTPSSSPPLTPPPTESAASSSPLTPIDRAPKYTALELEGIFGSWNFLVREGMEEYRFARFLDRKYDTESVAYWMNMYDAWINRDGPFIHFSGRKSLKRERAESVASGRENPKKRRSSF